MGASLIEARTATVLIVGPEDLGKQVADLLGDPEYSVRTAVADKLAEELANHDCDLVVLDLIGVRLQREWDISASRLRDSQSRC